jgi:gentisate 1,2-dioxygenase
MGSKLRRFAVVRPKAKTYYERWIEKEDVPAIEGFGVSDVRHLKLGKWQRMGCEGAYLQLLGLDGTSGVYVGRVAPGTMTEPERHLYEKVAYIVQGEGVAEIQQHDRVPQSIAWQTGSLFSPPLNALHRLINYSKEPAVFVAVTTAPMVFDHFHNERFVFNSDFSFTERYDGDANYFEPANKRYLGGHHRRWIWETNFIPDARKTPIAAQEQKGTGVDITQFEMCNNTLIGHLAKWPVGRYRKAHYHGSGAVLIILRSEGYSLMWPSDLGTRPYENGCSHRVVRVNWMPGSVFSPPANWFHQHFNTGAEPALQVALCYGSQKFPLGIKVAATRAEEYTSVKQGGTVIEHEDEDLAIRRVYEAELVKKGLAPEMNFDAAVNEDF